MSNKKIMYKNEDCGLFIGELSIPYENGTTFYNDVVKKLFSEYITDLTKNGVKLEGNTNFYNPRAYCLFGNYDLAVISMVDDFHFGSKYFHPYGLLHSADSKKIGFDYHITMGSCSSFDGKYLEQKIEETLLKKEERFPFIGITNIKIKNSLLIGAGYEVIFLATSALRKILNSYKLKNPEFDYLIFEPISWSELSIVFFSNSFKKISDALLVIREIDLNYAIKNCEIEYKDEANSIKENILNNSLMKKLLTNSNKKDKSLENDNSKFDETKINEDILSSHLFTHTYSNLGIDIEWLENYESVLISNEIHVENFYSVRHDDTFKGFTRWFVKPCYLEKFLNAHNLDEEFNLIIGNGDIETKIDSNQNLESILPALKKFLVKVPIESASVTSSSIRKTKTIPRFSYTKDTVTELLKTYNLENKNASKLDTYESISNKLAQFVFGIEQIKTIRDSLIKLKVAKALRERIINAFINYNDGIQDPILYTNFVELYHYLIFIKKLIESDANDRIVEDSEIRHTKYNVYIEFFDDAYKTSIAHSYRLYSVTDFNLDYNGGIQPILSGYDATFKFFRRQFKSNKAIIDLDIDPFLTIVSGLPVIKTISNTIRVNYNYLFNPEFFLAALPKESVNHYFSGLVEQSDIHYNQVKLKKIAFYYKNNQTQEAEKMIKSLNSEKDQYKVIIAFYMLGNAKEQIVSQFKKELLKSIQIHSDYKERMLMLEYIETINSESFFYFLEDQFASMILGHDDYLFWAWAIYSQESDAYNFDLTLNEKKLHRLLLRLSVIKSLDKNEHKAIFERFSIAHSIQVNYHASAMTSFTNLVLETEVLPNVTITDMISYVSALGVELDITPKFNKEKNRLFNSGLENGEICINEMDDSFSDLVSMIKCYLSTIKKLFPEKNIVLQRDIETGLPNVNIENYSVDINEKILLDPTGGTFTIGCKVRRDYFKLRNTLIKTLFSFSLVRKSHLFKENIY